ncbi:similarity to PLASMODIUM MEMBRANE PROTEIN (PLASMODIUM ANTIGEN A412) [Encephalitozoon cuniculi GB-M1]|uniref:Putative trafficking protein particle complex subunit TRS31 n=2 Tax=Encephalitozoon cuniculi TaxID=6035 RepID=TRS31_ENCCU|nr:transport protein particle [Encephalitozoon cuniculi GB-M1]KMV65090.1 transport protein particle [Encephalitozoon cuniculi EcunIII-L]CAD26042.2 similarity to PLASMODIUM MEMBRANE PROTEIN (PLASMODIUM ANTIGEN A412) [Encephalitozoon cuniculi GB-M1]
MSYLVCGMIEYLMEQRSDIEADLKSIGYEVGIKLLELCNFEREVRISTLLYRATFDLLSLVSDSDRRVEKARDVDRTYLLTDSDGLFSRFISVPDEWNGLSADSIVCGMIQAALMASGYDSEVTAFPEPSENLPNRVIFQIRILDL